MTRFEEYVLALYIARRRDVTSELPVESGKRVIAEAEALLNQIDDRTSSPRCIEYSEADPVVRIESWPAKVES